MKKTYRPTLLGLVLMILCTGCSQIGGGTIPSPQADAPVATSQAAPEDAGQGPVKLEKDDWSSIWIENANQSEQPRLLLVGDSIAEGYYSRVRKGLADRYYLGRYTTSKFLGNPDFQTELRTILERYQFEVIQINNGLHGWDYSIAEYRKGLEDLSELLASHAPQATIIWCLTTPIRQENNLDYLDPLNSEVILRNQAAQEVLGARGYLFTDLYSLMLAHPEFYRGDGYHYNEQGQSAQADLIIATILEHGGTP